MKVLQKRKGIFCLWSNTWLKAKKSIGGSVMSQNGKLLRYRSVFCFQCKALLFFVQKYFKIPHLLLSFRSKVGLCALVSPFTGCSSPGLFFRSLVCWVYHIVHVRSSLVPGDLGHLAKVRLHHFMFNQVARVRKEIIFWHLEMGVCSQTQAEVSGAGIFAGLVSSVLSWHHPVFTCFSKRGL